MAKLGDLRAWYTCDLGNPDAMELIPVTSPELAKKLIQEWTERDLKDDSVFCNAMGLEVFEDWGEGEQWAEWYSEEGIDICVESIERLKELPGVAGFHIMAIEWEEKVPEIVERAGLYPRPQVS